MLWWHLNRLKSNQPKTRIEAIEKIGSLQRRQYREKGTSLKDEAFDALCEMINDSDSEIRRTAIHQLQEWPGAFKFLANCLGWHVYEKEMIEALKEEDRKGSILAKVSLSYALAAENSSTQRAALLLLQELNPNWFDLPVLRDTVPFLIEVMKKGSHVAKEGAIAALGYFHYERVIESLKIEKLRQPELQDHFDAALKRAAAGLMETSSRAGERDARVAEQSCAICKEPLDFNQKMGGGIFLGADLFQSMALTPYRCRGCSALLCMKCAQSKVCPGCGSNIFDLVAG